MESPQQIDTEIEPSCADGRSDRPRRHSFQNLSFFSKKELQRQKKKKKKPPTLWKHPIATSHRARIAPIPNTLKICAPMSTIAEGESPKSCAKAAARSVVAAMIV
jgi:hypothetical protein